VRTLPEPAEAGAAGSVEDIPLATRDLVLEHLKRVTGRARVQAEDHLARDLNLDSLALVDLALWIEAEFGFQVGDGGGLETVRDVLLAALSVKTRIPTSRGSMRGRGRSGRCPARPVRRA